MRKLVTMGLLASSLAAFAVAAQAQTIELSPGSFSVDPGTSGVVTETLTISDTSAAPLNWAITEAFTDCGVMAVDVPWVSTDPITGTVPGFGSQSLDLTFDATGLLPRDQNALLCVRSNDPSNPLVVVPLALQLGQIAVGAPALSLAGTAASGLILLAIGGLSLIRRRSSS